MTLLYHLPQSAGWRVEVLATDISTRVLARARTGIWPLEKARQIPSIYLKTYMLRGILSEEGKMKVGTKIQQVVSFDYLNLFDESTYPRSGPFDMIFCRNVLIYFQPETKAMVIHRLLKRLAPFGYLFVGHSESLNQLSDHIRSVVPTVYVQSASAKAI